MSCPIIYINHYHYWMVDDVLNEIIKGIRSSTDRVVEFDYGLRSVVSFETKEKTKVNGKHFDNSTMLLKELIAPTEIKSAENETLIPIINGKDIFLFKHISSSQLLSESDISLLQTFAYKYEKGDYNPLTTIIIVSPEPVSALPSSIRHFVTVLEILPPSVEEIKQYITSRVPDCFTNKRSKKNAEDLVRTLQGLQMYEVKQVLETVLSLTGGNIIPLTLSKALEEKKRIVKKSGIIEVIDTDVKFEYVGGLQKIQDDLKIKKDIYKNLGDAVKYNIPIPKGILIIGMPGCGKSMIAKATADLFEVSLLRLDVSRLMGKYVGESEANLRIALATAEAAHPCVLWIDEIEKAFAGSNSKGGENDMLIMRMMGHFLTWMQERKNPVYIVATANDVMRPEFMRKGRFDEVYFVDFPTKEERVDILKKIIRKRYPSNSKNCLFDFSSINYEIISDEMKGSYGGFSGSEIECVLNIVVEKKFSEYLTNKNNNPDYNPSKITVTTDDFKNAIKGIANSVMANQKSKEINKKDFYKDKTAIERIKEMKENYKFINASGKAEE